MKMWHELVHWWHRKRNLGYHRAFCSHPRCFRPGNGVEDAVSVRLSEAYWEVDPKVFDFLSEQDLESLNKPRVTNEYLLKFARGGIRTTGCDCGHYGMGYKWHFECTWKNQMRKAGWD